MKNQDRDIWVHMFKTSDAILNSVISWAYTVKRIRKLENSSDDSELSLHLSADGTIKKFLSETVRLKLRAIVELVGSETLGFTKEDVSFQCFWSGGAMAMVLSGTKDLKIQKLGRWRSLAFMEYIRDQIESFTLGVSQGMIEFKEFLL